MRPGSSSTNSIVAPSLRKSIGKTRIGLLTNENVAHRLVTAVNANHVAGNVRRREKREPHDVIPMRMRQENVEARLLRRAMLRDQRVAELAHAGADVAQHILVAARFNLDTTRVAAVGAADGERQFVCDKGVDRLGTVELKTARREQRLAHLGTHGAVSERRRNRTAASPESDQHRR